MQCRPCQPPVLSHACMHAACLPAQASRPHQAQVCAGVPYLITSPMLEAWSGDSLCHSDRTLDSSRLAQKKVISGRSAGSSSCRQASHAAGVCEKAFSQALAEDSCSPAEPYRAQTAALKLPAASPDAAAAMAAQGCLQTTGQARSAEGSAQGRGEAALPKQNTRCGCWTCCTGCCCFQRSQRVARDRNKRVGGQHG